MHRYFWGRERLKFLLPQFDEGQFRLAKLTPAESPETKILMMFHGKIKAVRIPDMKIKRVVIECDWLSERGSFFDEHEILRTRWSIIPPSPNGIQEFDFYFVFYYPQPHRNDRLKLKGCGREFCRFYQKNDLANLIRAGDEVIPQPDSG